MSIEFDARLGSALRRKREAKGFSQEYVAERIGVTKNSVSHWELGKRSMYAEQLEKCCRILGCTMQEVFDEMEDVKK